MKLNYFRTLYLFFVFIFSSKQFLIFEFCKRLERLPFYVNARIFLGKLFKKIPELFLTNLIIRLKLAVILDKRTETDFSK